MTNCMILANAKVVLADKVMTASVHIEDGVIADITTGSAVPQGAQDLGGDWLIPGLIEVHTDNLERHMVPRPGVEWPLSAAILGHDREMASAGITTVYDAIRVGSIITGPRRRYRRYARKMADALHEMHGSGDLKISHRIHLRAEVCSETLLDELAEFGPDDRVGILSLMDHTPGQRQFTDLQKFEDYVCGKNGISRDNFGEYITFLQGLQAQFGSAHETAAVAAAARLGATLASHDDSTAAQVATSAAHGVSLGEFPTSMEAAQACHAKGIAVIMGAPNLVRGGSHSGNVAAEDLAKAHLLDIMSSDYVPASLLMSAVQLGTIWGCMARGIACVTANPARALGLSDRGRIAVGLRADLCRFSTRAGPPAIGGVWVAGARIS